MNPFRYITPYFFSGLMDDPILLIRINPLKESLLFDCGNINHIAKRIFKSISTVFITHAHMDHFIGIDTLIRNILVSPKTIKIFGPPEIAQKIEAKLLGYHWNLVEDYYCNLEIYEVSESSCKVFMLRGSQEFKSIEKKTLAIKNNIIYENQFLTVKAVLCDHKIPVLAFNVTEKPHFEIDRQKLESLNIETGSWLNELKQWFYHKDNIDFTLSQKVPDPITSVALYEQIKKDSSGVSLTYITDIGFNDNNLEQMKKLSKRVNILICECSFLNQDKYKARNSFHLCTSDVNHLIGELKPNIVIPIHLSRTYKKISYQLYDEITPSDEYEVIRLPLRKTLLPLNFESGRLL